MLKKSYFQFRWIKRHNESVCRVDIHRRIDGFFDESKFDMEKCEAMALFENLLANELYSQMTCCLRERLREIADGSLSSGDYDTYKALSDVIYDLSMVSNDES